MKTDNKNIGKLFYRLPYGIICGACAMVVFFATAGLIVSYIVFAGIASQTSDTVAFLEYGWQTALLIADVLFAAIMIAALVAYILKKCGKLFAGAPLEGETNENI